MPSWGAAMKHRSSPAGIRYTQRLRSKNCATWDDSPGTHNLRVLTLNSWLQERSSGRWVRTDCSGTLRDRVLQHSRQQTGMCSQNSPPFSPDSGTLCRDAAEKVARGRGEAGRKDSGAKDVPLGARSHQAWPFAPRSTHAFCSVYIFTNNSPLLRVERETHNCHFSGKHSSPQAGRPPSYPHCHGPLWCTLNHPRSHTASCQATTPTGDKRECCTSLLQTFPCPAMAWQEEPNPVSHFPVKPPHPRGA